jgi:subtilisin family serine protease
MYAADNGANIINLSLGGSWFAYNESASKAIKYAHKK